MFSRLPNPTPASIIRPSCMRPGHSSSSKPHSSTRHSLTQPENNRGDLETSPSSLWSRARLAEIPHADIDSSLAAPQARLTKRFVLCHTHDQSFPLQAGLLGDPLLPQPQKKVCAPQPSLCTLTSLRSRFFYQYLLTRVVTQYPVDRYPRARPVSGSVNNLVP